MHGGIAVKSDKGYWLDKIMIFNYGTVRVYLNM
jgi:hypothetical protein